MTSIPSYAWLLKIYVIDVLQRIDETKAAITSTFGQVLKVDSIKKVVMSYFFSVKFVDLHIYHCI